MSTSDIITNQVPIDVTQELSFFQKFVQEIRDDALVFVIKISFALLVFAIGCFVIRLIRKAVRKSLERAAKKNGFEHTHFVDETLKIILFIILFIIIAQYFGFSAASVVALLGSAGLTLGLGFQGALSNFAGGILLLFHKPFKIGDYVILSGGLGEGSVINIGIIYTTLSIADQRTIVVPNGALANATITNLTPNNERFLELTFDISYSSNIAKAKSIVEATARNNPHVLPAKDVTVFVSDLSPSSVKIGLRVFTSPSDYIATKWQLLEDIKIAFDQNNIRIPYNQLDVHINNQ